VISYLHEPEGVTMAKLSRAVPENVGVLVEPMPMLKKRFWKYDE